MSGTSADGIDIAAADLWAESDQLVCAYLGVHSEPFEESLRRRIVALLPPAPTTVGEVCEVQTLLGESYAGAFERARAALGVPDADLAVVHGQTVYHWVTPSGEARGTLQLGNAAAVAERTGLPVVSDLRSRDIAAGGQGAPLVALFDAMLLGGHASRRGAVNLGGIANITVVSPDGADVVAYDIGPAGAILDAAAARGSNGRLRWDDGGRSAGRGRVSPALLQHLLADPYYRLPWPRSTGREYFTAAYLDAAVTAADPEIAPDDLQATATRLVADLVAETVRTHRLAGLVMSGGGSQNVTLLDWVRAAAPGCGVETIDGLGVPAQAKEALAFAVLGYLAWNGLPGDVPTATGASGPRILGSLTPGAGPLRLPEPAATAPTRLRIVPLSG